MKLLLFHCPLAIVFFSFGYLFPAFIAVKDLNFMGKYVFPLIHKPASKFEAGMHDEFYTEVSRNLRFFLTILIEFIFLLISWYLIFYFPENGTINRDFFNRSWGISFKQIESQMMNLHFSLFLNQPFFEYLWNTIYFGSIAFIAGVIYFMLIRFIFSFPMLLIYRLIFHWSKILLKKRAFNLK